MRISNPAACVQGFRASKMPDMAKNKRIGTVDEILCATCKVKTKHTIRGSYESNDSDEESGMWWSAIHDLMSCNGCDTGTYRLISSFSEEEGESVTLYPHRGDFGPNRVPKDFDYMPMGSPLESVYRQTITAFNSQLFTLAGAGVRLLVEGLCKDKGVTKGTVTNQKTRKPITSTRLDGKINGMAEQDFITKQQAAALHEIRFLGNDAAHELDQPTPKTVRIAIDLIEQIFTQIYDQPQQAAQLAKRKRPGKSQKQ